MDYKIIASDLDGTLLNDKAEISAENLDAIKKLSELGVTFIPSTGRSFSEIPEEIRNCEYIRYYIYSNGTAVYDKKTGERILNCLSNETGRKVLDIVNEYEAHTSYRQNGRCYVDSRCQSTEAWDYYNVCTPHRVVVDNFAMFLDDFEEKIRAADNVEVYTFFFKSLEDKRKCQARLMEIPGVATTGVTEHNIEVFNAEAGKGNALRELSKRLSISIDATIGVGDSDNDTGMILASGIGLATSNACDSLKKISDEIICSNEEHVAEFILKKYFKKGENENGSK